MPVGITTTGAARAAETATKRWEAYVESSICSLISHLKQGRGPQSSSLLFSYQDQT